MQHPDHHHRHLPHPATTPNPNNPSFLLKRVKKRGNYNCGRCGLPKKGHKCHLTSSADGDSVHHDRSQTDDDVVIKDEFCNSVSTPISTPIVNSTMDLSSATSPPSSAVVRGPPARRGALYFDEDDDDFDDVAKLPVSCLWEILRRLPPSGLVAAGCVCRGWREAARRVWSAADEMRIRVPAAARIGFVGFVLQKCPGLSRLTLRIESDVDATFLACIAFSCPNLQSLDISTSTSNWISGVELSRFIADKKCLTSLKMEGCSNLGSFSFSSTSLSTLWLSGLNSLSKMVFNCPNLKEISLDFSRQENDTTDLASIMDSLGRSCSKLQNIHIASTKLSHAAVLALSAAKLRGLRMLSLVLGAEITDASVAAIASSFTKLELLDLSGSSISDNGIGIICNVFPETLSRLLLALCPNITSSGIQFATAQLPCLELLDCGMSISDPSSETLNNEVESECELQKTPNSKLHHIYQKLIIKHNRLRKLSLWGCSGLDALYLNCPHLNDLNLNSCRNLHPERLDLQCPGLQSVHASDCPVMLVETIETQVCANSSANEYENPLKRYLPDGSKRVRGPLFCSPPQTNDDDEKKQLVRPLKRQCVVIVNS